jgi:hypothetical protein
MSKPRARRIALTVTNPGKPASVTEIAALEFAAVKEFRGLTKVERLKKVHGFADNVRALAVLSVEIVAKDKTELIAVVTAKYEEFGPFLMQLANARDNASLLMDLIASAETRMAVALANIEGEDV